MDSTYDIFRRLPDSTPLWIESVQAENISARLLHLIRVNPGDYFVFDPSTAKIVATMAS
jgi:hypothetical protein